MMLAVTQHYLLDASVSTWLIFLLAALSVGAWMGWHVLVPAGWRRGAWVRAAWVAGGTGVGLLALLAVSQWAQRLVTLATSWPIWVLALLAAGMVELIVLLYAPPGRGVSRRMTAGMTALRIAVAMALIAMLAQPVIIRRGSRPARRRLTFLVDISGSMHMPETQWTAGQKLRMAALSGKMERPVDVWPIRRALETVRTDLARRNEWLADLDQAVLETRREKWLTGYEPMRKSLEQAEKALGEQAEAVTKALGAGAQLDAAGGQTLASLRSRLTAAAREVTEGLRATVSREASDLSRYHKRLRTALTDSAAALREAGADLEVLQDKLDEAHYRSLPAEKRKQIDQTARKTRFDLACDVLKTPVGPDRAALIDALGRDYKVSLYTFHSTCQEGAMDELARGTAGRPATRGTTRPTTNPAELPEAYQKTDLTGALRTAARAGGSAELAGLIVLSDFAHNASPVRPTGVLLAERKAPIYSVLLGSTKPPRDAAVLDVDAPETVHVGDKVLAKAQLKFDGLSGRTGKVRLYDGDEIVDTREVRIPTDRYRCTAELGHQPETKGRRNYRVEVECFEAELLETNNRFGLTVNVTDERTNLLIVEDRPRWEFRYLKNLFAGRDTAVGLQYVLFRPDRIEPDAPRPLPLIHAAVGRPAGQFQATALPAGAEEWNKFDVVMLGDVAVEQWGADTLAMLRRFVVDRGGALIVIAGPSHMPADYGGTPLKDLLPVTFDPRRRQVAPPENVRGFTIALTPEGLDSVVMHQHVDPERSRQIWLSIPPLYWRYGVESTRKGATVLAYARPAAGAPAFLQDPPPDEQLTDEALALRQEQMRDYQGKNPLIAVHTVGVGRVMFLATDHTWRMRYGVGDRYHHQFWGQVLRWAMTTRLSGGGRFARVGTAQSRYSPGQTVRVTARMLKPDLTPLSTEKARADLYRGDTLVDSRKLTAAPDSPGLYRVSFGPQAGGTYRVVLDAPEIEPLLRQEGLDKVACEFSVESPVPVEQAELAADRTLAAALADETGGQLLDPSQVSLLADLLKPQAEQAVRERQIRLWDTWPLLLLMLAAVTGEWILRKRSGLA